MALHEVRTTINPGEVLKVDDAELLDLTRQGLILPEAKVAKIEKAEAAAAAKAEKDEEAALAAVASADKKGE